jgi:ectoine hydroxylase-related dioxygenase (phytanoyl-CoA dioxygenase family)
MSLLEAPSQRPPPMASLRPPQPLPRLRPGDADALVAALDRAGCAVIENALSSQQLAAINGELDPWFEAAPAGEGVFFGRSTKRFSAVFAKAGETAALALNAPILEAVERVLIGSGDNPRGDCIQLNLTQGIEIAPGEPAQLLHRDDNLFPMPKSFELMVNVMWALDDFTPENGATRLAPGSHHWQRQEIEQYEDGVVDAAAPAGSAIIWLGSLLHGGGANRSSKPRRGLVISYSLAWLAPAEKFLLSIPADVTRALPERLQRLLGYQVHRPNLGWVEGRDPLEWLKGEIGALAPARDNLTPAQEEMLRQYLAAAAS